MDCNKEEAARAKNLAEEKMIAGDYFGARKFVKLAQRLFPELEDILQMKALSDAHCSEWKIRGLDNWDDILRAQFGADADAVYKKLALRLNPGNNKFDGAEAGQANGWLSDQIKRYQYHLGYNWHLLVAEHEAKEKKNEMQPEVDKAETSAAKSPGQKRGAVAEEKDVEESCPDSGAAPGSSHANENMDLPDPEQTAGGRGAAAEEKDVEESSLDSGAAPGSSHANENIDIPDPEQTAGGRGAAAEEQDVEESSLDSGAAPGSSHANENIDIPDPEFSVFEKEREPDCFARNEVWSTCDSIDGMPRRYVRVNKVLASEFEFKLEVTYLEPKEPVACGDFPVACGVFKNGESKVVVDRAIFSAQMVNVYIKRDVKIYPRKGEIWAVFRDVNNHELPYQYDLVEIVNDDFKDCKGIGVAYNLEKIEGSVSLFHRKEPIKKFTQKKRVRFSHKVPSVKSSSGLI